MRIAIFTDFYLPSQGGVQTSVYAQKLLLEKHGHTVTIVTVRYPNREDDSDRIALHPIVEVNYGGHKQHIALPSPFSYRSLKKQLSSYNIDVIHIQSEYTVALFGVLVARRLSIPAVYTSHTLLWKQAELGPRLPTFIAATITMLFMLTVTRGSLPIKRLSKEPFSIYAFRSVIAACASVTSSTIAPSKHLAETLASWGIQRPIAPINNFIFHQGPVVARPAIPTFLWIGRFDKEKRPVEFVKAIKILRSQTKKEFRAVMAGKGPLLKTIASEAEGVSELDIQGSIHYDDISSLYDASSAMVMTSVGFDNQPMVIAEAISHGRPVILQDTNLVDGLKTNAGLFTNDSSPESLAKTMKEFLEDASLREKAYTAAIASRELFSADHAYEHILSVYNSVRNMSSS